MPVPRHHCRPLPPCGPSTTTAARTVYMYALPMEFSAGWKGCEVSGDSDLVIRHEDRLAAARALARELGALAPSEATLARVAALEPRLLAAMVKRRRKAATVDTVEPPSPDGVVVAGGDPLEALAAGGELPTDIERSPGGSAHELSEDANKLLDELLGITRTREVGPHPIVLHVERVPSVALSDAEYLDMLADDLRRHDDDAASE